MNTKICAKCNVLKSIDNFSVYMKRNNIDYIHSYCKDCMNEYSRIRYGRRNQKPVFRIGDITGIGRSYKTKEFIEAENTIIIFPPVEFEAMKQ